MLRSLSIFCALALTTQAAHAATVRCLAGQYNGGATEVAAELILASDGRFRYGLSYGAIDERAQGRWESDGTQVLLDSDPVNPPRFSLVGESPVAADEFRLKLDLPDGLSPQFFNALLVLSDGSTLGSPLGYQTWAVPLKPGQTVVSVKFQLPALDLESERFALTAGTASEARFSFAPNDLGQIAFAHEPLTVDGRELLLIRHDREVRFRPERGGC
ncbi:hypothetical protein WG901_00760 [Novosphingobium sp. PS1R-30]|uniref:Uncharacterized protein n=1 Tax=Novosphingobium anseongense TaxID=3133436 RepID=A0ABU8RQA5_9SPHN